VVALHDGRVIAIRGERYKVFSSLYAYRDAAHDHGAWTEMTDRAARAAFYRQASSILNAVLGQA